MIVFPVPVLKGVSPSISQGYGGGSGNHKGVDVMYRRESKGTADLPVYSPHYRMPNGIPALAYTSGKVLRAGAIGTGGRVEIDHGNGLVTKYYHMRDLRVRAGDTVKAGQAVGTIYHNPSAPTATRTPYKLNHLHFEAIKNGQHFNPESMLKVAQMVNAPSPVAAIGFALVVAAAGYFLILKK
jgi:murein DD-endopeptidase MepM/ murein hydrolase activator NlpD